MPVVRTPAIEEPAIKQKFVLSLFYFTFIAVVRAALGRPKANAALRAANKCASLFHGVRFFIADNYSSI